jgi:hypothetical protein
MVFFTLKNKAYSNLIHAGGVGEDSMYGPPCECKGKVSNEGKSASMYSSIRAKMLSRTNVSLPLLEATLGVGA